MANYIADYYHNRIELNKNWLCIICGETGSGKSYSALRIAELCDSSFDINRVVFNAAEFMELLRAHRKRGDIIVFDEAGVGLPSREWFSLSNKAINYVLQTFRALNLGVIFTTPSFNFIDSQTRRLFHSYIQTQHIFYDKEFVRCKWFNIEDNPRMDKLYFKYPRIQKDNRSVVLKRLDIYKPSASLIAAYEKKKRKFCKSLYEDIEDQISQIYSKELSLSDIASEISSNPSLYLKSYHNRSFIDLNLIMNDFNIGQLKAKKVKAMVEKELRVGSTMQSQEL